LSCYAAIQHLHSFPTRRSSDLGYVGLPLARLFATKFPTVGFDINRNRIAELRKGIDSTLEVENEVLQSVLLTSNPTFLTPSIDQDRKSTRLNSSHVKISYAVFC